MPTFKIILQEQGAKKAKKNVDGLNKSLGGMAKKAALAAGGFIAVNKVFDALSHSIQAAGKFEGVQTGFDNLAQKTGFSTAAFSKFNKALDGTVKSTELMTMANNAMLLGITDNENQMAQMFDTAQRLAKAVGEDAAFGVNSLVVGIGRQSKLMLDNLGIMIDTNQAYDNYAASLGKTASELDETERKQAFTNAALAEAERLAGSLGEEQLTLTDQINQGKKAVEDIAIAMGQLLTPAVSFLARGFNHAATAVASFLKRLQDVPIAEAMMSTSMEKLNEALSDRKKEYADINTQQAGALLTAKSFTLEEKNRMIVLESQIKKLQERKDLLEGMTETERIAFAEKEAQGRKGLELIEQAYYAEQLQFTDRAIRRDEDKHQFEKVEMSKLALAVQAHDEQMRMDNELLLTRSEKAKLFAEQSLQSIEQVSSAYSGYVDARSQQIETLMNNELQTQEKVQKQALDNLDKTHEKEMSDLKESFAFKQMSDKAQRKAVKDLEKTQKQSLKDTQKAHEDTNEAITDSYAAERTKIAQSEKDMKVVSAIMDGYSAVTTTFGTLGYPLGIIPATLVAGIVGMQVNAIKNTPIPKFAQGGDFVTSGEQMIMVGDNPSGRERVQITPLNAGQSITGANANTVNVNISGSIMSESYTEDIIIPHIKDALRRGESISA